MIGNCQGQTELSLRLLPTEGLCQAHASCQDVPSTPLIGAYLCSCSSFFSAPSFCVLLRSTAKRDQSFICAYPAFREGLHGRLSLGNPPALKQSLRVYREGTPSLAQAGISKDRRELALAESKLPCHPHAPGASLARLRIRPISSLDSWSGCRPFGISAIESETFPRNRSAN